MKTKNIVIIIVVILILVLGIGIWIVSKKGAEEGITPPDQGAVTPEGEAPKGTSEEEKENPYDSAKEVKPASDLNAAFHNDFKAVLDLTFGGAKLTEASSDKWLEDFSYIVKRKITEEDAQKIKDLFEEKGYETTSTSAGADKYSYDFSKEVLGEKYDDINVRIWLEEGEGIHQQEVRVSVYK